MRMNNPLQDMRNRLQGMLPSRAFLRRDRGDCLLVTNAPAFGSFPDTLPGFICFRQEQLLRILPDESWIQSCEGSAAVDFLSRSLLRFRGQKPDMPNLKLFAMGAKLLDMEIIPESEATAYDQRLRQRAALALRGGCGGGLYACALLGAQINANIKGEDQT